MWLSTRRRFCNQDSKGVLQFTARCTRCHLAQRSDRAACSCPASQAQRLPQLPVMADQLHRLRRLRGAAAYRELFWKAGMIGQALCLAAEAAGVRRTDIGCCFDEVLHRALGMVDHDWQSLRTDPPYPRLT